MNDVKTMVVALLVVLMFAGCHDETTCANMVRQEVSANRKRDERVISIASEITNMPQKLDGKGLTTKYWGIDLAKSIMALDDPNERLCLINKYFDAMSQLKSSLNERHDASQVFRNYELLIDACTAFANEPEITERLLEIMCECVRLHRREVKKLADAIQNEPNHRARVPLKNIHGCMSSYFLVFTNRIERTYFPWMKSHGLPPDRHEIWRQRINDAEGNLQNGNH